MRQKKLSKLLSEIIVLFSLFILIYPTSEAFAVDWQGISTPFPYSLGETTMENAFITQKYTPNPVTSLPAAAGSETLKNVHENIISPTMQAIITTLSFEAITFAVDTIAYNTAVWLASGANGQTPMVEVLTGKKAWEQFGLDVAADALGGLSSKISGYYDVQFNLCAPPDPLLRLGLQLGIIGKFQPPKPKCDWQQISANWTSFYQGAMETAEDPSKYMLEQFAKSLEPGQNTLSYVIGVNMTIDGKVAEDKGILFEEYLSKSGIKDVVDVISGNIKTPAALVQSQVDAKLKAPDDTKQKLLADIFSDGQIWAAVGMRALSVFSNTLISNVFKNIREGLLEDIVLEEIDLESGTGGNITWDRQSAEDFYSGLVSTVKLGIDNYSVLTEFVTCSASSSMNRQSNSCVMDASFLQAIAKTTTTDVMTVSKAIDEGFLNGNWPLYRPDDLKHNQDPLCYTYGYCYGNLVKLRKARIIPIGWELAASSAQNSSSSPITLQEVVDGFNYCNSNGKADAEHPWCHLIDPNWVLKYPSQQCLASMIGEQTLSTMISGRSGSCVDSPSCISDDINGNCESYGYCTREMNSWNFNGDSCPEEYSGCLSFTNTNTTTTGSWLFNTLDRGICSSDSAGCMWYRTNKYFDNVGTVDESDDGYEWSPGDDVYITDLRDANFLSFNDSGTQSTRASFSYDTDSDDVNDYTYNVYSFEDRIYFNSEVQACSESSVGCSEVYLVNSDLSLNILRNPSFEDDEDNNDVADYWTSTLSVSSDYDEEGSNYYSTGSDSYHLLTGDKLVQNGIPLQPGNFYTISVYVKGDAGTDDGTITLDLTASDNQTAVNLAGYSTDCVLDAAGDSVTLNITDAGKTDFTRFDCSFTTPFFVDERLFLVAKLTAKPITTGSTFYIDALQLEAQATASVFHEGYNNSAVTAEYLQLPPDWLGCSGNENDPKECANYAAVCSSTEVGCSLYTPADGDPAVPAVLASGDDCPAECVGYATYRQEDTAYDTGEFPLYFIAETAQSCTSADVGCDEYTNLETEGTETFSYLRACVTPEMNAGEVYFTWEGSDQTGYQLVSYQLLKSNLSESITIDYTEIDSDAVKDSAASFAPCTTWDVESEAVLDCADNTVALAALDECNEHADILINPDCREFYDKNGQIHYRLYSDTVSVSDDCTAYRKATPDQIDCDNSGGYFTAAGECRYFVEPNESTACSETAAGCREYTGGSSRNASVIFSDYFEEGSYDNWQSNDTSLSLSISNESVAVDGHSLRVVAGSGGDSFQVLPTVTADQIVAGKTFVISFWAKGTGSLTASLVESSGDGDVHNFGAPVILTGSWQLFELGPIDTSASGFDGFGEDTVLTFFTSPTSSQTLYLDNVQLEQTEENLTLIKDSWITPSTCNQTPAGAPADQYYLGCEEYSDQNGDTSYIYQFSNLCSENAVGCEAVYDTQNSDSPYVQLFNVTCFNTKDSDSDGVFAYTYHSPDEDSVTSATTCTFDGTDAGEELCTIAAGRNQCQFDYNGSLPTPMSAHLAFGPEAIYVPADQIKYLVVDENFSCEADNLGCIEVGQPTFSQDRSVVESFESVYILNQPDTYGTTQCSDEELFCGEWASTQDGNYYFKDPGDKNCEYKTGVTVNNATFDGWFRKGTNEFCYGSGFCSGDTAEPPTVTCNEDRDCASVGLGTCTITDGSYLINGDYSGIWLNGDSEYKSWVGACSSQYNLCTEFVDPLATQTDESSVGKSFFYLDNQSLDETSLASSERCDGQVSLQNGCVLFADQLSQELSYASSPSYLVSEHADVFFGDTPRSLQDTISCDDPDTDGVFTLTTGDQVNVCKQRCRYSVDTGHSIDNLAVVKVNDTSTFFGAACLYDNDCPIGVDNITAADVEGTCFNLDTEVAGADVGVDFTPYFTNNDTNRILKVYRDRECAEWLSCSNSYAAWDERISQWVDVCEEVKLCDQYDASGTEGGTCTSWTDQPAVVLDLDQYTGRDTSWYGLDYSGYSIPEQLPVEFYGQFNIYPEKACTDVTTATRFSEPPISCEEDDDCSSISASVCWEFNQTNYNLAYIAASCDGESGTSCTAGYCTDSGKTCSEDDQCVNGNCIVGYCKSTEEGSSCTSDTDCLNSYTEIGLGKGSVLFNSCEQGVCVYNPGTECSARVDCSGLSFAGGGAKISSDCQPGALAKTGTCYNDVCLVGIDGQAFEAEGNEEKSCRGYPEISSPFPGMIVNSWIANDSSDGKPLDSNDTYDQTNIKPYDFIYGFNDASYCTPTSSGKVRELTDANDCSCSYEKATYGESAAIRYYQLDTPKSFMLDGVCISGPWAGKECSYDSDCNDPTCSSDSVGTNCSGSCSLLNKSETLFGWDGYCLERDSSVQIFGSSNDKDRFCLTWLPIDQLAGSRDMYANDTGAGYGIGEDIYYCSEVGMYADLYPLGTELNEDGSIKDVQWACAAAGTVGGGEGCDYGEYADTADEGCGTNLYCPNGYFALLGYCDQDNKKNTNEDRAVGIDDGDGHMDFEDEEEGEIQIEPICSDGGDDSADVARMSPGGITDSGDDCPYFCIPEDGVHIEGDDIGEGCLQELLSRGGFTDYEEVEKSLRGSTPYFRMANLFADTDWDGKMTDIEKFQDCVVRGVPAGNNKFSTDPAGDSILDGAYNGYGYVLPGAYTFGAYGIIYKPINEGIGLCADGESVCKTSRDCPIFAPSNVCEDTDGDDVVETCSETGVACSVDVPCEPDPASNFCDADSGRCHISLDVCDLVTPCPSNECDLVGARSSVYSQGSFMKYLGCYEMVQVSGADLDNKAWTNRLYSSSDYRARTGRSEDIGSWGNDFNYSSETLPRFFGEAQFEKYYNSEGYIDNQDLSVDSWPLPVASCSSDSGPVTYAGCSGETMYPGEAQYVSSSGTILKGEDDLSQNLATPFEEINESDWTVVGTYDYEEFHYLGNSSNKDGYSIIDLLQELFAEVFTNVWQYDWEDSGGHYSSEGDVYSDSDILSYDISNTGDENGSGPNYGEPNAPTVSSVDVCYGTECREGKNNTFTVNDTDDENLEGNGGSLHVGVQFFAYANNNQMPIRNVIVDWGDGERMAPYEGYAWPLNSQTGSSGDTSYFKNRRGFDSDGKEICNSEPNEWGLTSEACQTAYFSFEKDYYCSSDLVAGLVDSSQICKFSTDGTGRLINSPCTGGTIDGVVADKKCVFQPRVYVKDNWGWCTGYCPGGADEGDGCYDGSEVCKDSSCLSHYDNECNSTACPSDGVDGVYAGGDCDDADLGTTINPWINYDGVIILDWQNPE